MYREVEESDDEDETETETESESNVAEEATVGYGTASRVWKVGIISSKNFALRYYQGKERCIYGQKL